MISCFQKMKTLISCLGNVPKCVQFHQKHQILHLGPSLFSCRFQKRQKTHFLSNTKSNLYLSKTSNFQWKITNFFHVFGNFSWKPPECVNFKMWFFGSFHNTFRCFFSFFQVQNAWDPRWNEDENVEKQRTENTLFLVFSITFIEKPLNVWTSRICVFEDSVTIFDVFPSFLGVQRAGAP